MQTELLAVLPLAVVCHDAGGANQIIALLKRHRIPANRLQPFMQGPAAALWTHHFPGVPVCPDLPFALDGASALLSGTGWASSLEHDARCEAARRGLPSAALLDHWVNYPQRFIRDGHRQLPDEMWVCDAHAEALARTSFPGMSVRRIRDHYLAQECAALTPVGSLSEPRVLFVCEPALSNWGRDREGEFQALDYFLSRLDLAGIPPEARIVIRPHPSEPQGKYDRWLASQSRPGMTIDAGEGLRSALARSRWVAGCQSYAMVVALAAGRTVYSALPPWAPACRLPHPGILHLKDL